MTSRMLREEFLARGASQRGLLLVPLQVRVGERGALCTWLLLSHRQLFMTLWTAAHQASLSFTIPQSLLKLMSIEAVITLLKKKSDFTRHRTDSSKTDMLKKSKFIFFFLFWPSRVACGGLSSLTRD